jgi:hypothetical protein
VSKQNHKEKKTKEFENEEQLLKLEQMVAELNDYQGTYSTISRKTNSQDEFLSEEVPVVDQKKIQKTKANETSSQRSSLLSQPIVSPIPSNLTREDFNDEGLDQLMMQLTQNQNQIKPQAPPPDSSVNIPILNPNDFIKAQTKNITQEVLVPTEPLLILPSIQREVIPQIKPNPQAQVQPQIQAQVQPQAQASTQAQIKAQAKAQPTHFSQPIQILPSISSPHKVSSSKQEATKAQVPPKEEKPLVKEVAKEPSPKIQSQSKSAIDQLNALPQKTNVQHLNQMASIPPKQPIEIEQPIPTTKDLASHQRELRKVIFSKTSRTLIYFVLFAILAQFYAKYTLETIKIEQPIQKTELNEFDVIEDDFDILGENNPENTNQISAKQNIPNPNPPQPSQSSVDPIDELQLKLASIVKWAPEDYQLFLPRIFRNQKDQDQFNTKNIDDLEILTALNQESPNASNLLIQEENLEESFKSNFKELVIVAQPNQDAPQVSSEKENLDLPENLDLAEPNLETSLHKNDQSQNQSKALETEKLNLLKEKKALLEAWQKFAQLRKKELEKIDKKWKRKKPSFADLKMPEQMKSYEKEVAEYNKILKEQNQIELSKLFDAPQNTVEPTEKEGDGTSHTEITELKNDVEEKQPSQSKKQKSKKDPKSKSELPITTDVSPSTDASPTNQTQDTTINQNAPTTQDLTTTQEATKDTNIQSEVNQLNQPNQPNQPTDSPQATQHTQATQATDPPQATQTTQSPSNLPLFPIEDASGSLRHFFQALHQSKQGRKVRIMHYGDSLIAGDYVTQTTRRLLQKQFGDGGHGFFFSGKSSRWYNRSALSIQTGGEWKVYRITNAHAQDKLYGVGGASFQTKNVGAWVKAKPTGKGNLGNLVGSAEIFYQTTAVGGTMKITFAGQTHELSTKSDVSETKVFKLSANSASNHEIKIELISGGELRLFGIVFETPGGGITYDSLGLEGSRAKMLMKNQNQHFAQSLKERSPDLLILHYGTNESGNEALNGDKYAKELTIVLDRFKQWLPNTSCMLVSPMDRGKKDESGKIVSFKSIQVIVDAQRKVAKEKGCAFWSSFDAMGGAGSMGKWFNHKLASGDLAHPTSAGADRLGAMFFLALMHADQSRK